MPPVTAPPPPHPWLARGFERYVRGLAARRFRSVWLGGPGLRAAGGPANLFIANHTNWWDGFLAFLLTARLGLSFHILMDARQLDRYALFRGVGALPLRRGSPTAAYHDLGRAARCLEPGRALWLFPQGTRRPAGAAVSGCERGAAHLALTARKPVRLWPVAFRYTYLGEDLPEAFIWAETPREEGPWTPQAATAALPAARRALTGRIEARLAEAVTALDRRLEGEDLSDFSVLVPGRLSINKRLDRWRQRLGLLDGRFEGRNG